MHHSEQEVMEIAAKSMHYSEQEIMEIAGKSRKSHPPVLEFGTKIMFKS